MNYERLPGNELTEEDKALALRAYVNRHTGDHPAAWAKNGEPVHFRNDTEWLERTHFRVNRHGRLMLRSVISIPTHPEVQHCGGLSCAVVLRPEVTE
jgi:hypothetical protein